MLTAILLSVLGAAQAQKGGTVQGGAQRTFSVSDLQGDRLGRIVASNNYQVSLVLPAEIQNVGINASKQTALVPTVDKSDGRVMYLDVLRPGGYATLNIRLVSEGEPVILKLTVELSEATGGVLTYTITTAPALQSTQAPRTAAPVPTSAPAPARRVPTTPPVRPVTTAATTPMQVVPRVAAPAAASSTRPVPADGRRALSVQGPAARATSPAVRPVQPGTSAARQEDGLSVEVSVAPGQSGPDRTVTYRVRDVLGTDTLAYILAPRVTLRASGQGHAQAATTTPNVYQRVTGGGVEGTFTVKASALLGSAVVLFEVRPVDTRTQKPLPARYVGVMVRP
ncbi:hypothetical protein [Deinococcus koreensis]|uniref:Uncharacterized protein n=1 Tax=Deinococcus koreensis TaxID=2054903 RepID=A0A2K3US25_9DEIO|nr:hypothetical protein [Deinococcus koreensis]PNY79346.1 hypothetical protein CVO96_19670 [Deinococcus koreensis]